MGLKYTLLKAQKNKKAIFFSLILPKIFENSISLYWEFWFKESLSPRFHLAQAFSSEHIFLMATYWFRCTWNQLQNQGEVLPCTYIKIDNSHPASNQSTLGSLLHSSSIFQYSWSRKMLSFTPDCLLLLLLCLILSFFKLPSCSGFFF